MNGLDVIILIFVALVVARGVRSGFLAGALSLVGVVLGASLGSRLAPMLLAEGEDPVVGAGITLASIFAFAVLGDILARALGRSLRTRLTGPASEVLDGLGGGALGLALSLTMVWVMGIFALQAAALSGVHETVRDSAILDTLNDQMPSELLTQAVAELDPLPQVQGPEVSVGEPDAAILRDPEVLAASSRLVRVTGIACGYGVEGSGWAATPKLVVTNAHVVAGEVLTRVQPEGGGPRLRADVVLFDPRNDIAVLRVKDATLPTLPLAEPETEQPVAVLGFPENGPLDVQPGRTGPTRRVISTDAYNRGPIERIVTSFRVFVRPGNSGGPVINADGEVVATIFASRANASEAGYGIPSSIVSRLLKDAAGQRDPVSTGKCAG
jgi:S1-C subfamily serine protease